MVMIMSNFSPAASISFSGTVTLPCLPYDPSSPEHSLAFLIQSFADDSRVYMDMTGGLRDAALLMTLAARIVALEDNRTELGSIVYAAFKPVWKIQHQESTFAINGLIEGLKAFTEHGKADMLVKSIEDSGARLPETKALGKALLEFSDDLALCQVSDLVKHAEAVERSLLKAQRVLESRIGSQQEASLVLDAATFAEDEISPEEQQLAEETIASNEVSPSEILLLRMMEKMVFIPSLGQGTSEGQRLIAVIRWCVERQMLVQALALFVEQISVVLFEAGYYRQLPGKLSPGQKRRMIVDLCSATNTPSPGSFPTLSSKIPVGTNRSIKDYFEIDTSMPQEAFSNCILWFKFINSVRNRIIHTDTASIPAKSVQLQLGRSNPDRLSIRVISELLFDALDAFDTATKDAASSATFTEAACPSLESSAKKSIPGSEQKGAWEEALVTIIKFLGAHPEKAQGFTYAELAKWSREQGLEESISRDRLGIGQKKAITRALVARFPQELSAEGPVISYIGTTAL